MKQKFVLTLEEAQDLMKNTGGSLYLSGTGITAHDVKRLQHGDYVPGRYLYADGILTHVKEKRSTKGYTYFVGKIPGRNVISDGISYAHCKKFAEGRDDLLFKAAKDRGADQYKGLSVDTEMSVSEAKAMYRIITGACQQGTEMFIAGLGDKLKGTYTIREMLKLTKGQYGAERFAAFFEG